MSRRQDWVRLRHMLDGVRQALEFVSNRNRVDSDVLWETVTDDFPGLRSELETILAAEEQL